MSAVLEAGASAFVGVSFRVAVAPGRGLKQARRISRALSASLPSHDIKRDPHLRTAAEKLANLYCEDALYGTSSRRQERLDGLTTALGVAHFAATFRLEHLRLSWWSRFVEPERVDQILPASSRFLDPRRLRAKYDEEFDRLLATYRRAEIERANAETDWAVELLSWDVRWAELARGCMDLLAKLQAKGQATGDRESKVVGPLLRRIFEKSLITTKRGAWYDRSVADLQLVLALGTYELALHHGLLDREALLAALAQHARNVLPMREVKPENFARKVPASLLTSAIEAVTFAGTPLGGRVLRWIPRGTSDLPP